MDRNYWNMDDFNSSDARGGCLKSIYVRLRVVPHFSSGIVERMKRERA